MDNNAELAAETLRAAAAIFQSFASKNEDLAAALKLNVQTCEIIADLVDSDPEGEVPLPPDFEPERNWLRLLDPYKETITESDIVKY